jgi:hypothetical protein
METFEKDWLCHGCCAVCLSDRDAHPIAASQMLSTLLFRPYLEVFMQKNRKRILVDRGIHLPHGSRNRGLTANSDFARVVKSTAFGDARAPG